MSFTSINDLHDFLADSELSTNTTMPSNFTRLHILTIYLEAPNPGVQISTVSGLVCHVVVSGASVMCGAHLGAAISLRRHIRQVHPGAMLNPSTANIPLQEIIAGENAERA
ncbi:hypothetical protein BP00DRAFT_415837 [Aspergillus indologenus CBS 114.80]|uniref:Uncharacterized protein n=1 Tax=Aspergillus indologenus CBS 114.80 TaxID=1450541 RepID=A0A2V5I9Z8_9EURO|nr:hypothetical protein BP00DRAFT_415837 [Aspergillus indologenus CBS 114.80]